MKKYLLFLLVLPITLVYGCTDRTPTETENEAMKTAMEKSLKENLLDTWYPKAVDWEMGGYFSDFTFDFQLKNSPQEKMIVTQARHLWSNSKAAILYPDEEHFKIGAKHGFI